MPRPQSTELAKVVTMGDRPSKKKGLGWKRAANQKDMLDMNWTICGRESSAIHENKVIFDFADDEIRLETHDREKPIVNVSKEVAQISKTKVVFSLNQFGCVECGGNQIYNLVLEEKGDDRRLQIEEFGLCCCKKDCEWNKIDVFKYSASPKSVDSSQKES